jgi:hypothetical protein
MVMETNPHMLETSSWYHGPRERPFDISKETLTVWRPLKTMHLFLTEVRVTYGGGI